MVEYALILAGTTLRSYASVVANWWSDVNWTVVTYVAIALVALRIAFWAFAPRNRY